ncbi:MAG TPA: hypothetical protein PKV75_11850 [Desulfobacterales bacterium]|nr:hypothetical protein [Desulfobacterales bacterium]
MRIEDLRSERTGKNAKVAATVIWETCDRPSQEIYFETVEEFAEDLTCNPHSFLLACVMPAMRHGEERVFIDEEICPELRDGILTSMAWFRNWYDWYGPNSRCLRIESKTKGTPLFPEKPYRAGFFFSGGIDSLATLRSNRLNYPPEHPGSIRDGLLIGGFEIDKRETFEQVVNSMSDLTRDADITLIPIYTNIRQLDDDWGFWAREFQGAVLSSVAHVLAKRLSLAYIASSDHISDLFSIPLGSHPLIDPNYTSSDLRIKHDGITLTRFAKTRLIADWDAALQTIRVCTKSEKYTSGMLNCGRCEKCVRTMLALIALGALEKTRAFAENDINDKSVMAYAEIHADTLPYYSELLAPLEARGRYDLARAIRLKIAKCHEPWWKKELKKNPISRIYEFDQRYFQGRLRAIKKRFYP